MKKTYRNKNKSFRVFKSICILWLAQVLFSSCAGPLFISEEKWKLNHLVYFKVNQTDITASNKSGEKLKLYPVNEYVAVYIPTLRPRDLKITLSHPNRLDTTIKIKRTIRPGALFFDCTFGAILTGIPLLVDLVNKNIYQIKKSSRILSVNMLYNNQFYDQKFKEAEKNGSITAYENFIKNFPESKLATKAQEQVYNIAWNNAKSKNTISAYENFISKYPNSPKVEEAKRIKNKAKEIDDAYSSALKVNKYITYKSFLENYKLTKYNSEVAEKMANAYCEENKGSLNNLKQCNDAVKFVKDIQAVNKITANKLTIIENKRDELLANEIQKVKSKTEYFNLLINQHKSEAGKNFSSEQDAEGIRYRVFTRGLNLSGMFAYWNTDGTKVVVNYANGKKQGVYTKLAVDEKTILENGNFISGREDGIFLKNFENGKKHYEQTWSNGSLLSETEFDEQGKNLTEERFKEYIKDGDHYYRISDYKNAMNSYSNALNVKKNVREIMDKYAKAREKQAEAEESINNARILLDNLKRKNNQQNIEFNSEMDLITWLEGKTFTGNGTSIKIDRNGINIKGIQVYFNLTFKLLGKNYGFVKGQSLINPDGVINIYIFPSKNAIENKGDVFYAE